MPEWINTWAEATRTATGFFWKAGWAFVLGYAVSGMIHSIGRSGCGGLSVKRLVVYGMLIVVLGGLGAGFFTGAF